MPLVAPGDKVELGFGADDKIKVTGAVKEIRVAYRIKWPGDRELSYAPQPVSAVSARAE